MRFIAGRRRILRTRYRCPRLPGSQPIKSCPSRLRGAKGFGQSSAWSKPPMSSSRPLSGLTVIEIGHSVAAPYAGMILGELGAEVIKVENPKGGDACRGWGPPFTDGTATAFHAFNRAKRGVAVDLTDSAHVEKLHGLIRERADVLIHNLKFGPLDRYGLSAAALTA